ncbi:SMP-30/gluconolactonase/LRE family protein [Desulfobacterales bacterium HSG17]|nr:SMP-30/gluconolactonase/LRE family protein [Desulfobacterales bacterium HSG17]
MKQFKSILCSVITLFVFFSSIDMVIAEKKATKEECISKCEDAAKLIKEIGIKEAAKKIMDKKGSYKWKDSYVFCIEDEQGKMLAHPIPRFLNFPMKNFRDADGETPFADVLKMARKSNKGWKSYMYVTPGQGIAAKKTIYFIKVPEAKAIVCAGFYETPSTQKEASEFEKIHDFKKAELFSDVGGNPHGIAFDNLGNMFIAVNGRDIIKVKPDGEYSDFCTVKEAKGFGTQGTGGTYLFDLEYGPDNKLYAAAENKILKITSEGNVSSVIQENFPGRWGVCGIVFDNSGNMYAAYGNKVCRYTPGLEKSIFIDGDNETTKLVSAIGIEFDSDFKNLFICDSYGGKVVKVSVQPDNTAGDFSIVYQTQFYRPEYIAVDSNNNVFISNHGSGVIIKVGKNGQQKAVKYKNLPGNQTIAFAGKGFEDKFMYITSGRSGEVFKVNSY